jgi:hypothetical protein
MLQDKKPTSYNLEAEQGLDDMSLARQWDIPASYAYTPEINQQVISKVAEHTRKVEYEDAISKGFSNKEATAHADNLVAAGIKRANKNVKEIEKYRRTKKK